jgi:hypothetical protein
LHLDNAIPTPPPVAPSNTQFFIEKPSTSLRAIPLPLNVTESNGVIVPSMNIEYKPLFTVTPFPIVNVTPSSTVTCDVRSYEPVAAVHVVSSVIVP